VLYQDTSMAYRHIHDMIISNKGAVPSFT
jgi:hypothetical protein